MDNKDFEFERFILDMIADAMLNSDVSEDMKNEIRAIKLQSSIYEEISSMIDEYVMPRETDPEIVKSICEYLELVLAGIQQFKETLKHKKGEE